MIPALDSSHFAVLVVGILCRRNRPSDKLVHILDDEFGRRTHHSVTYPFDFTDYYEAEFGSPLRRQWLVYEDVINPARIQSCKLFAVSIEDRFRDEESNRLFNIDIGYVTGSKFVLTSRKNHSHRIYLGQGIHAEVTLRYENGRWITMPNTYPEFEQNQDWLHPIRNHWLQITAE